MYVGREARNGGVGFPLVEHFLRWAGDRKAEQASVTAHAINCGAMRFYGHRGFRPRSMTLEMPL